MRRATGPCKQLNSEGIKGTTLDYMSPVIAGQCSIVSAKCVWNVSEKELAKSWNNICKKRDLCDRALSGVPNGAFFFSAISTHEKKKGNVQEESEESEEEPEPSPVPSTSSEQWLDGSRTRVNKLLWPSLTYWIALTSPNGAPAKPLVVHRTLLECGMGVTAKQVQFQDGKECIAIRELYNLLKDHKNPYMQDLVTASYEHNYREELSSLLAASQPQELEGCGTENVVRVTVVNPSFQQPLSNALEKMMEAKLQIDKFGFTRDTTLPVSEREEKHLSEKLTILVNDITIAMQKLQYASYQGKVYKRDPRANYTYTYKCEASNFINTLATNEQFKSRLIQYMKRIIELLSDPHCELFHPLVISYDLIEVNDGVCWSLKDRAFKENAIEERQIGKVSPRAFCAYDPSKHADPKYRWFSQ